MSYTNPDFYADSSEHLRWWWSNPIDTYEAGEVRNIANFDNVNVIHVRPLSELETTLPVTLEWVPRPASLSDRYELRLCREPRAPWDRYHNCEQYLVEGDARHFALRSIHHLDYNRRATWQVCFCQP